MVQPLHRTEPQLDCFAGPFAPDPGLEDLLKRSSALLIEWLGESALHAPRPALTLEADVIPGLEGQDLDSLFTGLKGVMAGAYRPNHPGSLAHLDPPALSVSIAADLIAAGLNNNLLAQELSPSLSRLERRLCQWLSTRVGLGPDSGGVPASGGSLSNLMALVCARQAAELAADPSAVVLTGSAAHVSLNKAAAVMGLPPDGLQSLQTDADGRLQPEVVDRAIQKLRSAGRKPFALVAVAGTTVQGSVDPLIDLAALCRREQLWLHVDGAIGAVCALVDSQRWRVDGIHHADSITLNPQKVLGVSKPSSVLLMRQVERLEASFATGLPYMESGDAPQGGDLGLQGTRSAEVLKLWLSLQHLGLDGIERILDQAFYRADYLRSLLTAPQLQLLAGDLHVLAIGLQPHLADRAKVWRDHTHGLLHQQGFWLSKPDLDGRPLLKAVLGNPFTSDHHLERLAGIINRSARELS